MFDPLVTFQFNCYNALASRQLKTLCRFFFVSSFFGFSFSLTNFRIERPFGSVDQHFRNDRAVPENTRLNRKHSRSIFMLIGIASRWQIIIIIVYIRCVANWFWLFVFMFFCVCLCVLFYSLHTGRERFGAADIHVDRCRRTRARKSRCFAFDFVIGYFVFNK